MLRAFVILALETVGDVPSIAKVHSDRCHSCTPHTQVEEKFQSKNRPPQINHRNGEKISDLIGTLIRTIRVLVFSVSRATSNILSGGCGYDI